MFYRLNENKNAQIFHDSGEVVTRLHSKHGFRVVWPIGSDLSAQYEHIDGLVLSVRDAKKLGIESEI